MEHLRYALIACFAAALCACNPVQAINDGMQHSSAVSTTLEKSTGLKSQVGFNYFNGKLGTVNVVFQGAPANLSLPDVAKQAKAAVLTEFKEAPQQVVLSFAVGN